MGHRPKRTGSGTIFPSTPSTVSSEERKVKKHPYPGWGTHMFQECYFAEEDKSYDEKKPPSKKPKYVTESTAEIHAIKDDEEEKKEEKKKESPEKEEEKEEKDKKEEEREKKDEEEKDKRKQQRDKKEKKRSESKAKKEKKEKKDKKDKESKHMVAERDL